MTPQFVESVMFDTMKTILLVSSPALFAALLVGLTISIFQATTQINEMTLAYIPKIVTIFAVLVVFLGFMLDQMMAFTSRIFSDFGRFVQ